MQDLNALDWIAIILVIVGALNWGMVGLLKFDLVKAIFRDSVLARFIYTLVGISGLYLIYLSTQIVREGL